MDGVAAMAAITRDKIAASYGKPVDARANAVQAARMALTEGAQARLTQWVAAADPRVTAAAMYEDVTTDLRPALPAIAAPITVVAPFHDGLPRARVEGLYRAAYATAPHVTLVPVADSAHFVMLDQPAAFAAAVTTFLR